MAKLTGSRHETRTKALLDAFPSPSHLQLQCLALHHAGDSAEER